MSTPDNRLSGFRFRARSTDGSFPEIPAGRRLPPSSSTELFPTTVESSPQERSADPALDDFMEELYEAISFLDGEEPDWTNLRRLLHSEARFTRVTPEGTDVMTFDAFKDMVQELIEIGVYTGFHEAEVEREVVRFGDVLHVLSAYETRTHADARECLARGINSLQLLHEGGRWLLLSLFWDEGAATPYVPVEKVFQVGRY